MTYSDEFEVFWKYYPKRWDRTRSKLIKRKKFPAWESWQKLDEETQHEILTKAKYIKDFEGGAARDAVTWLNQRGWDDIEFSESWKPVLPAAFTDSVFKDLPKTVDIGIERNRQKNALGVK